ncbi:MAG: hypothetical protein GDYSWBUE_000553 [Candidatus Fervidibacterota bacterium]
MINATSLSLRGLLRTVCRIIAQLMALDGIAMRDFTNELCYAKDIGAAASRPKKWFLADYRPPLPTST